MNQHERQLRLVQGLIDAGLINESYSGQEDTAVQVIGGILGAATPEFSYKLVQGRRLAFLRTHVKHWDQEQLLVRANAYLAQILAPRIGCRTTISRIERGIYDLSYAQGLAFCHALGADASALSPWAPPPGFGGVSSLQEIETHLHSPDSLEGNGHGDGQFAKSGAISD